MKLRCLTPKLSTPTSRGWKPDEVRGSRQARGYGRAWEITRERIMQRDQGLCQPCLKVGKVTAAAEGRANQVDHVTAKAIGRALGWTTEQIEADANLQVICVTCHKAKSAAEAHGPGGRV